MMLALKASKVPLSSALPTSVMNVFCIPGTTMSLSETGWPVDGSNSSRKEPGWSVYRATKTGQIA